MSNRFQGFVLLTASMFTVAATGCRTPGLCIDLDPAGHPVDRAGVMITRSFDGACGDGNAFAPTVNDFDVHEELKVTVKAASKCSVNVEVTCGPANKRRKLAAANVAPGNAMTFSCKPDEVLGAIFRCEEGAAGDKCQYEFDLQK